MPADSQPFLPGVTLIVLAQPSQLSFKKPADLISTGFQPGGSDRAPSPNRFNGFPPGIVEVLRDSGSTSAHEHCFNSPISAPIRADPRSIQAESRAAALHEAGHLTAAVALGGRGIYATIDVDAYASDRFSGIARYDLALSDLRRDVLLRSLNHSPLLRYFSAQGSGASKGVVSEIVVSAAGYIAARFPVRCPKAPKASKARRAAKASQPRTHSAPSPANQRAIIAASLEAALSAGPPDPGQPASDETAVAHLAAALFGRAELSRSAAIQIYREAESAARWLIVHSGSLHARLSNALLAERFLNEVQIAVVVNRWRATGGAVDV